MFIALQTQAICVYKTDDIYIYIYIRVYIYVKLLHVSMINRQLSASRTYISS